jgi:hypothetical protein
MIFYPLDGKCSVIVIIETFSRDPQYRAGTQDYSVNSEEIFHTEKLARANILTVSDSKMS